MRIAIVDTWYPDFVRTLPTDFQPGTCYRDLLRAYMSLGFSTSDAYSREFNKIAYNAIDVVANIPRLQNQWATENGYTGTPGREWHAQVQQHDPTIIFLQDVSIATEADLLGWKAEGRLVAAQISCPMPSERLVRHIDLVFTSFPHYIERLTGMGVKRAVYSTLAFDTKSLERTVPNDHRSMDVVFCGGVGENSHWRAGGNTLETVARELGGRFNWFGYGRETLNPESALFNAYRGESWGNDMIAKYRTAKIVINRHGEVAEGWANNQRIYEATGCGALLVTEHAANLHSLFPRGGVVGYRSDAEAVAAIKMLLHEDHAESRVRLAKTAEEQTLSRHTYAKKIESMSQVICEEVHGRVDSR